MEKTPKTPFVLNAKDIRSVFKSLMKIIKPIEYNGGKASYVLLPKLPVNPKKYRGRGRPRASDYYTMKEFDWDIM